MVALAAPGCRPVGLVMLPKLLYPEGNVKECGTTRIKHLGGNVWSRRINQADRLVYEVFADSVEFLQARYHY